RATTVKARADHYVVDLGADRVYVRWSGPERRGMAADWANGRWHRIDDPALGVALLDECPHRWGATQHGFEGPVFCNACGVEVRTPGPGEGYDDGFGFGMMWVTK